MKEYTEEEKEEQKILKADNIFKKAAISLEGFTTTKKPKVRAAFITNFRRQLGQFEECRSYGDGLSVFVQTPSQKKTNGTHTHRSFYFSFNTRGTAKVKTVVFDGKHNYEDGVVYGKGRAILRRLQRILKENNLYQLKDKD